MNDNDARTSDADGSGLNGHASPFDARVESLGLAKSTAILLILRGVSFLTNIVLVPLSLGLLGTVSYGVWVTVASFLTWVGVLDLGIGNGLRNRLTVALSSGRSSEARALVSSAYTTLGLMAAIGSVVTLSGAAFANWPALLNAPKSLAADLRIVGAIVFCSMSLRLGLGLVQSILLADQRSATANLLDTSGNLVGLALVGGLWVTGQSSFVLFAVASTIGPLIVYAGATIFLFSTRYRSISPSRRFVERGTSIEMAKVGLKFFVLQSVAVVLFSGISLVIAHLSGPEDVALWSIVSRYFGIPMAFLATILIPYWSAYTRAYSLGELEWIRRSIHALRWLAALSALGVALMVGFSDVVYEVWLGPSVRVPLSLSLSFAVYVLLSTWCNIHVALLNGIGKVQLQIIVALGMAVGFLPLSILVHRYILVGSAGVMVSLCLLLLIPTVLWPIQTNRLLKRSATGIWAK